MKGGSQPTYRAEDTPASFVHHLFILMQPCALLELGGEVSLCNLAGATEEAPVPTTGCEVFPMPTGCNKRLRRGAEQKSIPLCY